VSAPTNVCRSCGEPDPTAMHRPESYTVLCAECHLDLTRGFVQGQPIPAPEVRVWEPRETGVLKYSPFRPGMQNGGSR
jgi:hypothetical protein